MRGIEVDNAKVQAANDDVNDRMEKAMEGFDLAPPEHRLALIAFMLGGAAEVAASLGMDSDLFFKLIETARDEFLELSEMRHDHS